MAGRGAVVGLATSREKGTPKSAVERCTAVRELGIAGDAHFGPGPRQVSILTLESIRRMEQRLGEALGIGRFGENVVVEGLDLGDAREGDLIACGAQVVFEVTAIGKECHQGCDIRRRTGDCIMPREGVFARVVLGGEIALGARVRGLRPARDLTVAVLAGGRSTRFDTNKRCAELGGRDLLTRALDTARALTPNVLLSVGQGERAAYAGLARVVEDVAAAAGPLAEMVASFRALETPWVAFLPVDASLVPADLLRSLSALAGDSGAMAEDACGTQPPVSCWSRASAAPFEDALTAGRFAIHPLVERLQPVILGPEALAQLSAPAETARLAETRPQPPAEEHAR